MKTILFDFDGTLMDTWPGIEKTLRASLRELEIPLEGKMITRTLVGIPLMRVFEELLGGDPVNTGLATQKYRELFPVVGMSGARPFEGAVRMLEALVTARNEVITRQMMKEHGLTGLFTWVRGEQEGEVPDGKAHMVAEVLDHLDLDPEDCVMVGDRRYDMEAARANGVRPVGVTYGYGTKEELLEVGAEQLAGSISELEKILLNSD
jgi:phosphoglycolate phosphatase